ncbi:MAG: ketoacyl-ACP synthase III [Planctomycetota bacterium]|nr:ketoacyl-ACP synthase III [Planctomycetota bacterium]MDA1105933.1 ketoacyl-ACP synthase III [Planctomycetota bacterium]
MSTHAPVGVRILGTGSALPEARLTNADFERMVDTSDEWIRQRTGISERRICRDGEGTFSLSLEALSRALEASGKPASDLDLVIVASVGSEMRCPSSACRLAAALGNTHAAAFDLVAACSGFVYAMVVADTMVRSGRYKCVGVVGAEHMTKYVDYTDRSLSILFGDGAGAAVLVADPDPSMGCRWQTLGSDGSGWHTLYIPEREADIPECDKAHAPLMRVLRMNGREVYKFAVNKFCEVMGRAFSESNLTPADVSQIICHQSNIRIINSVREKFGLPAEKVYINIDRVGNTSAASVGICLDELWREGKITRGQPFIMVAFGGGLTWAAAVWDT